MMYEDVVGRFAETGVKIYLERDGYKVMPYGVEYALRTGVSLTKKQYKALSLPTQIKRTPDFLVISPELDSWRLVEVKFRSQWNDQTREQLKSSLTEQAASWGVVHVILGLRKSADDNSNADSHVRVAPICIPEGEDQLSVILPDEKETKLWDEVSWEDFHLLPKSFPACCKGDYGMSRFRELANVFENFPERFTDEVLEAKIWEGL